MPLTRIPPTRIPPTRYWQQTVRLSAALLCLWFVVTVGFVLFAPQLDFIVLGWPVNVWLGGQGALIVYCLIVLVYAVAMDRLDRIHAPDESD